MSWELSVGDLVLLKESLQLIAGALVTVDTPCMVDEIENMEISSMPYVLKTPDGRRFNVNENEVIVISRVYKR